MDPVEIPIDGTLDLHHFSPKDIPDLLNEYIMVCREKNILSIRIIHGKGKGIQRDRVQKILKNHRDVLSFTTPEAFSGGWGATVAELKPL